MEVFAKAATRFTKALGFEFRTYTIGKGNTSDSYSIFLEQTS